MKKRILIFSLAYYPRHVGGAEVAIREVTKRLSDEFEFHMITLRFDSTLPRVERVGDILVHRIGFSRHAPSMRDLKRFPLHLNKFFFQAFAPLYALSLHRKYRYDILWAMMAHSTGIAAALFSLFAPKVKYVLTLQEGDPPAYIERLARPAWPLFRRAFTRADTIQAISTFLARWARKMGFEGEALVIPNGVDTQAVSRAFDVRELEALKANLGKKRDDVFLVTTSRLVHKNGIDTVIEALPLLDSHIKFLVLGTGPDEEKLREEARRRSVEGRVMFLGYVHGDEIPPYLKISDIFIRPSRSEGMGISFIEAFAAGLPVIATQEGGIADFLFDEKRNPGIPATGFAVEKDHPQEVAAAVDEILAHPEKTAAIVARARSLAHTRYDWDRIAGDMRDQVFRPLCS